MILRFTVYGEPKPAGSKKAFVNKKTGKAIVTDDSKGSKPWKQEVAAVAMQARVDAGLSTLLTGPVRLEVTFIQTRPKHHYGTGRNADKLKDSAPTYPTVKPDATKLLRAVEDALTGVLWKDDNQVVDQFVYKRYGTAMAAAITVIPVRNDGAKADVTVG
jgi:Holliday junction resolvase RusA-like endonuclease